MPLVARTIGRPTAAVTRNLLTTTGLVVTRSNDILFLSYSFSLFPLPLCNQGALEDLGLCYYGLYGVLKVLWIKDVCHFPDGHAFSPPLPHAPLFEIRGPHGALARDLPQFYTVGIQVN
jgi:hypothetical protein